MTLLETGVSKATILKPLLCPVGFVGMLQLFLAAALLESTSDFSLRDLLLMDLPAVAVSSHTIRGL